MLRIKTSNQNFESDVFVARPPKENLPRQALRLRGGTLLDVSDAFQKALPAGRYVIIWWLQFRPTWSFKKPLRLSASVCYGGKRLELIRHVSFSPEPDQWKEAEVGCFELETDEVCGSHVAQFQSHEALTSGNCVGVEVECSNFKRTRYLSKHVCTFFS